MPVGSHICLLPIVSFFFFYYPRETLSCDSFLLLHSTKCLPPKTLGFYFTNIKTLYFIKYRYRENSSEHNSREAYQVLPIRSFSKRSRRITVPIQYLFFCMDFLLWLLLPYLPKYILGRQRIVSGLIWTRCIIFCCIVSIEKAIQKERSFHSRLNFKCFAIFFF